MISTIEELLDQADRGKLKEHTFPNVELKRSWENLKGTLVSYATYIDPKRTMSN